MRRPNEVNASVHEPRLFSDLSAYHLRLPGDEESSFFSWHNRTSGHLVQQALCFMHDEPAPRQPRLDTTHQRPRSTDSQPKLLRMLELKLEQLARLGSQLCIDVSWPRAGAIAVIYRDGVTHPSSLGKQ